MMLFRTGAICLLLVVGLPAQPAASSLTWDKPPSFTATPHAYPVAHDWHKGEDVALNSGVWPVSEHRSAWDHALKAIWPHAAAPGNRVPADADARRPTHVSLPIATLRYTRTTGNTGTVRLHQVPLPSALPLMLVALGAFGVCARFKRRP